MPALLMHLQSEMFISFPGHFNARQTLVPEWYVPCVSTIASEEALLQWTDLCTAYNGPIQ